MRVLQGTNVSISNNSSNLSLLSRIVNPKKLDSGELRKVVKGNTVWVRIQREPEIESLSNSPKDCYLRLYVDLRRERRHSL